MRTINMHEAKTHLSRLVEAAANANRLLSHTRASHWSRSLRWKRRLWSHAAHRFLEGKVSVP